MHIKKFFTLIILLSGLVFYSCESNDSSLNTNNIPPTTIPNLLVPGNNSIVSTLQPAFDWSDVASSAGYILQISRNENYSDLILDTSGITVSQYSPSSPDFLNDSSTYYWRVKSVFASDTGDWSQSFNFSTLLESINATNKVLVEIFTNTSCIPCVETNRYFDDIYDLLGITSNDASVVIIRTHTTLFAGDPFYLYNTTDNSARMLYYNAAAVNPRTFLLGTNMGSFTASAYTNKLNEKLASLRTYAIALNNTYNETSRSGNLSIRIKQVSGPVVNDLVYHFAVTENELIYAAPNGESRFENTLRDLVTPPDGQPFTITPGQTKSFSNSYSIDNVINDLHTDLTVFVQSVSTKEVYAAEKIKLR